MKLKIYFGIIAILTCFLIYAVFFMKSDYITDETLPPTVAVKQVTIGDTNIKTYTPDFLPKEVILKGRTIYGFISLVLKSECVMPTPNIGKSA